VGPSSIWAFFLYDRPYGPEVEKEDADFMYAATMFGAITLPISVCSHNVSFRENIPDQTCGTWPDGTVWTRTAFALEYTVTINPVNSFQDDVSSAAHGVRCLRNPNTQQDEDFSAYCDIAYKYLTDDGG
jgi:hypothetical protein